MTKEENLNLKVAVRVRPFNEEEKNKQCKNIIAMSGQQTFIKNPSKPESAPREFMFDYSYWSHDGFREIDGGYLEPEGEIYVDQKRLFTDLGTVMVENVGEGFNCSVFAYGQTGSGKSYTIMGHGPNQGVVPQICQKMFEKMTTGKDLENVMFKVTFSMLEVYNEKVRDLLSRQQKAPSQGLPVREHPTWGFYVPDMTMAAVQSYGAVEYLLSEGNKNRTIAATKMNKNSSRAHTIVTLKFAQIRKKEGETTESVINMVDLAGSERVGQTQTEGDRFQEGNNINKALTTLGIVIKNVCARSAGRTDVGPVPYRNSKLTMLLRNTIGGNSKAIMIATISPSDESYQQTYSTLLYAENAKQIRNKAKVNVADTTKLIQELLEEKQQLMGALRDARRQSIVAGYSKEELKQMQLKQKAEIEKLQQEMLDVDKSWQSTLESTKRAMEKQLAAERKEKEERKKSPHLWNLNEDPTLTNKVYHLIKQGHTVTVGNSRAKPKPSIELFGPNIAKDHAVVSNRRGVVYVRAVKGEVLVNGEIVTAEMKLAHQDRVVFGTHNLFVLHVPAEEERLKREKKPMLNVSYELARKEIGKNTEISIDEGNSWLKHEVAEMVGRVRDANTMAIDLDKSVTFELQLLPSQVLGLDSGKAEINVVVRTKSGLEFLWTRNNFLDRYDLMIDMYQKFEQDEKSWNTKDKDQDPFWEPASTPTLVGVVYVPLECLAYMMDLEDERYTIYDYRSEQIGYLTVSIVPCTEDGVECGEDRAEEEYIDLVDTSVSFKIKIKGANGIPKRFKSSWCKYSLYPYEEDHCTEEEDGLVPKYEFEHLHQMMFTRQVAENFIEKSLAVQIFGRQIEPKTNETTTTTGYNTETKKKKHSTATKDVNCQLKAANAKLDRISELVRSGTDKLSVEIKEILMSEESTST